MARLIACQNASTVYGPNENPVFINAGPGHTLNLEAFFRFLVDCAKDPRFNADNLMREINLVTDLPFDDRLAYRFLIIPMTKKRLVEREAHAVRMEYYMDIRDVQGVKVPFRVRATRGDDPRSDELVVVEKLVYNAPLNGVSFALPGARK